MLTPLVIAMPEPMADALGYPRATDRVGRHPHPGPVQRRLGRLRPPRVGPVPARQDEPELLDLGPERPHRPDLRRHRQDRRPHLARTSPTRPSSTSPPASSPPSCTTATRRSRSSTTSTARTSRGTSLTYVSAVAVEEKSVIDYNAGNPDGDPRAGRGGAPAAHPARRHLPGGGHALLRQPVLRPRGRLGRPTTRPRAPAASPSSSASPRTRSGCSSSASDRPTPTSPSARPVVAANGVDPDQPHDPPRGARARGHDRPPRPLGGPAQAGPGAARDRRVRLDERPGRPSRTPAAPPGSTSPRRRPSRRSTCSRPTTRSRCACSRPTWTATA